MNREEILERARMCVCGERQQDYGSPEDSFAAIADLWTAYLVHNTGEEIDVNPVDVACMMALLKIARICTGRGTDDCFIDLAGYAACGGEISAGGENGQV